MCKGNMSSYQKIKFYEFIIRYFIKKNSNLVYVLIARDYVTINLRIK